MHGKHVCEDEKHPNVADNKLKTDYSQISNPDAKLGRAITT